MDPSGSSALFCLITAKKAFICNVGNSKALVCKRNGLNILIASRDHKPTDLQEQQRIINAGGSVSCLDGTMEVDADGMPHTASIRVQPGGLNVTRAFGHC